MYVIVLNSGFEHVVVQVWEQCLTSTVFQYLNDNGCCYTMSLGEFARSCSQNSLKATLRLPAHSNYPVKWFGQTSTILQQNEGMYGG